MQGIGGGSDEDGGGFTNSTDGDGGGDILGRTFSSSQCSSSSDYVVRMLLVFIANVAPNEAGQSRVHVSTHRHLPLYMCYNRIIECECTTRTRNGSRRNKSPL